MINPQLLPPPPHPSACRLVPPRYGGVQQQVIHRPAAPHALQRLPRKVPRRAQVRQLERQHRQAVPGTAVYLQGVVRGLGAGDVAGAEDEAVRFVV